MAAKTNIVYLILDADNNPAEFAAIDAESNEYIKSDNLDPQTRNVRTGFANVSALDTATRVAVTDNSSTWTSHTGVSAAGFQKWNQTTTDVASVSANIATNTVSATALNHYTGYLGNVSGNMATNAGNITTNTNAIAVLDDDVDYLGTVSANIATNTGNISTNLGKINVLDDDVDYLGTVSANIATNTGNITTLTASATALNFWTANLGTVSGNIATNAGNITTLQSSSYESFSYLSGQIATVADSNFANGLTIATHTREIQDNEENIAVVGGVSATIEDNTQNIAQVAAVSANIATNTTNIGNNSTVITSGLTHGYSVLSSTMNVTRGGGNLSAVSVSAAGESTVNNAVPTFKLGANKIAWEKPAFTFNPGHTAIEIPDVFGNNLTVNFMTGGTAKLIASGIEAKSLETNTFTSDNVTASAHTLQVGASLGCPIPNPFGYIQLTSDDVASSDEKHVGYSNTPTSVLSDTDHISWDDSAKNFVVKFAGTYEVVARVFFEGGSTLIEMHINKEGSPVNTANPRAHTTVDPVERTISAIFTCAIDDVVDVTYEATSAQTTAAQIGTTVTIKRLK